MPPYASVTRSMDVEPHHLHDELRFDGETIGGNRSVTDSSRNREDILKAHSDSHLKLLLRAYVALLTGQPPFVQGGSRAGRPQALVDENRYRQNARHDHLDIFERNR